MLVGCGSDPTGNEPSGSANGSAGGGADGGAGVGGSGTGGGGAGGGTGVGGCLPAEGPGTSATNVIVDDPYYALVTIDEIGACQRTYHLSTTAPLRDGVPENPRTYSEAGLIVRTGNDMLDALYALALEETREASVASIQDWAFNGGDPIDCPEGGCFETGRLWTYVWTRDTAYSVWLGLAALDPTRARNSLEFKLSERRDGGDRQIVQDTGTGGSWPISSDRVAWALAAWELLKYLDGAERDAFRDLAYEAIANTAEHDRAVVYDPSDGLYRGEQSFLDWREQSYPGWVAQDPVQIGTSKTLSTNVAHLELLRVAAALAEEKALDADSAKYQGWADELASDVAARFWLEEASQWSSLFTAQLDTAPARRFDLLGSALAVLSGIGSAEQRAAAVASYPHLPKGAPVIWPQQQLTAIYHNRAIWPFATAIWLRAARSAGNDAAAEQAVRSLMRGAALNLSNMENFEAASGANWLDDGAYSGPVVNSQRQLWSVAGFVSMVHELFFGIQASQSGLAFAPFVPRALRNDLLAGAERIALSGLTYKGKRIVVQVDLGAADARTTGALVASSVKLNGVEVGTGYVPAEQFAAENLVEVTLAPQQAASVVTMVDDLDDWRNVFGPRTPSLTGVTLQSDRLVLGIDPGGESAADIELSVYRDGVEVATGLPGSTTSWSDDGSADHGQHSYCYSVEAVYPSSGNVSQRAKPMCWWGPGAERIVTIGAASFVANGGTLVNEYGKQHYQGWGDPSHTLTVSSFTPSFDGLHYLQLVAGNGAGPIDTGVACGVKLVEVKEGATLIASGYLLVPQLGAWDVWRESSLLPVVLDSAKSYSIVIREDERAVNMSERSHFASYGGTGGTSGRYNRVNVAEVKLLAVAP